MQATLTRAGAILAAGLLGGAIAVGVAPVPSRRAVRPAAFAAIVFIAPIELAPALGIIITKP